MNYQILQGDNRETLKTIPDNSIDAIVTDPPYGIDFLGKSWDANTGALETYAECLRVLKPGGHLLAFSAARTYHHLAVTLEQAGFEIRDQIMWIYSSGFPKSQDVGKQLNKKEIDNEWSGWGTALKPAHEPIALARKPIKLSIAKNCQVHGVGALNIDATRVPYDDPAEAAADAAWRAKWSKHNVAGPVFQDQDIEQVRKKQNKPAGGGNNAATFKNFSAEERTTKDRPTAGKRTASFHTATGGGETQPGGDGSGGWEASQIGRFPANVIGEIPLYQKYFYCPKVSRKERHIGCIDPGPMFERPRHEDGTVFGEGESSWMKANVDGVHKINEQPAGTNNHPTVKPIELMKYLIRLITPAGGTVLDPFNGSGSTGCAAVELGHPYIGCELDPAYVEIAQRRIEAWYAHANPTRFHTLFDTE